MKEMHRLGNWYVQDGRVHNRTAGTAIEGRSAAILVSRTKEGSILRKAGTPEQITRLMQGKATQYAAKGFPEKAGELLMLTFGPTDGTMAMEGKCYALDTDGACTITNWFADGPGPEETDAFLSIEDPALLSAWIEQRQHEGY